MAGIATLVRFDHHRPDRPYILITSAAQWYKKLFSFSPDPEKNEFVKIWDVVSHTDNTFRKPIVLACRAQEVHLTPDTHLGRQLKAYDIPTATTSERNQRRRLRTFLLQYNHLITDPLYASLVLDICRAAPYLLQDYRRTQKDSWNKEIGVFGSTALPSLFNYNVWFKPNCQTESFCYDLPPNPQAASYIYEILCLWRARMCTKTFFPRMSRKSMSLSTQREWESLSGDRWDRKSRGEFSQVVLECWQHENGIRVGGRCELRQKWYRSQIAPRTYVAQGGTAYNTSKFAQELCNELTELIPSTNYLSRLNPSRIRLESSENLRIWDLTTFTSNHHETRHFLRYLADFCSGYTIRVFDPIDGLLDLDFGTFWNDYTAMNTFPEYSLERVDDYYKDIVAFHNVAGFLGVFGNLAISTFVHGASVLMVTGDPNKLNVAGDDGHCASTPGTEEDDHLGRVIRKNGVIEDSKYFWTYETGSVCLKRGVVQLGDKILVKEMILWPSSALIHDYCTFPNARFNSDGKTKYDLQEAVSSELLRFMTSIFLHPSLHARLDFTWRYINNIYDLMNLPEEGSVPQLTGGYLCPLRPRQIDALYSDPLRSLIAYHYHGLVTLPKRDLTDEHHPTQLVWEAGYEFFGQGNAYFNMMSIFGYLSRDEVFDTYMSLEGFERLLKEFAFPVPAVSKYTVLKVPDVSFQL